MKFYSYGNIVRILDLNEQNSDKSRMIDVNIDEKNILSSFDSSRPFDAAFIKSFLDILSHSITGFTELEDKNIQKIALDIIKD